MDALDRKEMIKSLISENKLAQTIVELAKIDNKDINSQIVLVSSRRNALHKSINTGVISQNDIETERNQISNSLLRLTNQINKNTIFKETLDKETIQNLSNSKNKFEFYTAVIGLLTALIALSSAGFGIYKGISNSEEISKTYERVNATHERINELSSKFEIINPREGDTK